MKTLSKEWLENHGYEHNALLGFTKDITKDVSIAVGNFPNNVPCISVLTTGGNNLILNQPMTVQSVAALEQMLAGSYLDFNS